MAMLGIAPMSGTKYQSCSTEIIMRLMEWCIDTSMGPIMMKCLCRARRVRWSEASYSSAPGRISIPANSSRGKLMISASTTVLWVIASSYSFHHFEKPPPPVAPEITAQPIDQNATVGSTVSFTVEANGTNSNYQWQKTTNMPADENSTWINTGSNAATLTINNVQLVDNNSSYRVTVSNSAGSATSNPAQLTVFDPSNLPVITRQPSNWVGNYGQPINFDLNATGMAPLTYQCKPDATDLARLTALIIIAIRRIGSHRD